MKYKIRKTNEIVDVVSYSNCTHIRFPESDFVCYIDNEGNEIHGRGLNLIWDFEPIEDALLEFLNELLEKQGSISKINEKLRQYREYLVKETERWHKKEEDETLSKIGKQDCIGHANAYISARAEFEDLFNYDSWLKKQGEQKTTNNIEPKFKVGDWVIWDNKISCHIDNIYQGKNSLMYTITDTNNMTRSYSVKGFDNNAHLWTIQDAKDGDILANDYSIIIFRNIGNRKWNDVIDFYAVYNQPLDRFSIQSGILHYGNADTVTLKPATKEQRDLLLEKIVDAGYIWDTEKKVLTKLEDEHIPITEWIEDYWKHHKVTNPDSYNRGKEIQFDHDGFIRFCQTHCQKPAWSEEDEEIAECVLISLEFFENLGKDVTGHPHPNYFKVKHKIYPNSVKNWLESLKERIQPQPKQDWNNDDELIYQHCLTILRDYGYDNWFKERMKGE